MKSVVTITDITRMAPPFVCVAGVDQNHQNIRVLFRNSRITEQWLKNNGITVVHPFARVGFLLLEQRSQPPHTEDWFVDPYLLRPYDKLANNEQLPFLASIQDRSVQSIFNSAILQDPGYYIKKGTGNRSLGTIKVKHLYRASYQCYERSWDCYLYFEDFNGDYYNLKVKDLFLCNYLDYLRKNKNITSEKICYGLVHDLNTRDIYLRIGLARGWARYPDRCYLQITGVYTNPDYMQRHWFTGICMN